MSKPTLLAAILIFAVPCLGKAESVTLGINTVSANGPLILTNSVTINSDQVIEWVAWDNNGNFYLDMEMQGHTFVFPAYEFTAGVEWKSITPITGPATIRVRKWSDYPGNPPYGVTSLPTFEISPQATDPANSVIVLPSGPGAYVNLESSTDLEAWSIATNGVYADTNLARFFRITLNGLSPQPQSGSTIVPSGERTITLVSSATNTATYSWGEYETAQIVAHGWIPGFATHYAGSWEIVRGGILLEWDAYGNRANWRDLTPVRGPATFRLLANTGTNAYCTLKITAEQYPPDKTLITLPGTNSYNVELQGSTNLKDWTTATNGVYTVPAAMFFRINSERVN